MQTINQPDTDVVYEQELEVFKDGDDGYLSVAITSDEPGDGFSIDPHRARQLYNAIGAEMGFDKPAKTRSAPNGAQAYKGNGKHKWELVSSDEKEYGHTYRLRVPGGWLYRTVTTLPSLVGDEAEPIAVAQSFVPVPNAVGYAV